MVGSTSMVVLILYDIYVRVSIFSKTIYRYLERLEVN